MKCVAKIGFWLCVRIGDVAALKWYENEDNILGDIDRLGVVCGLEHDRGKKGQTTSEFMILQLMLTWSFLVIEDGN